MRKLGLYLLADNRRAALIAVIGALLPLVMIPSGFISAIVVGLVTLHKGVKAGLMVLAFAILPTICLWIVNRGDFFNGYDILVIQCVLVGLFAAILRRTASWRWVLEIATVLGALAVMAVHVFIPNVAQMWMHLYHAHMPSLPLITLFHESPEKTQEIVQYASTVATGALSLIGLLGVVLLLLVVRWWETAIYSPGALKTEFERIRVDRYAAGILVLATLGLYWKSVWLLDLYPVLLLPFMIGGLSIVHKISARKKEFIVLLVTVYMALFLVPFFAAILLALIGFSDSWIVLRKRLAWLR